MKIIMPEKKGSHTFGEVPLGEVFIDLDNVAESGEEEIYMRMEELELMEGCCVNAVNLRTGDTLFFEPDNSVDLVYISMKIDRK